MEKGTRAFVSYIRGYKEHHCRFIFRFAELHLGRLAAAFAILRLPKMPEVPPPSCRSVRWLTEAQRPIAPAQTKKAKSLEGFVQSDVDPATVPVSCHRQVYPPLSLLPSLPSPPQPPPPSPPIAPPLPTLSRFLVPPPPSVVLPPPPDR